ncbi:hypothetical protein BD311DRAFT_561509 [Dichomitus squalens]|uniref:Uncharacterized protein n=1 Tax=Dichomitus squalens TaxID=114155 RepID=A0A4Q9ME76_9APHY|nr:hypothetical protein BD311DRAFT_561509 [Dichomitus squalens]
MHIDRGFRVGRGRRRSLRTGSPRLGMDGVGSLPPMDKRLSPKLAMSRSGSNYVSYPATYTSMIPQNMTMQHVSPSLVNGNSSTQYLQIARHISPQITGSSFSPTSAGVNGLSLPPQASINPSPLSRRCGDYINQSQEVLNGLANRTPIDYPGVAATRRVDSGRRSATTP